jgi:hypothetical protein
MLGQLLVSGGNPLYLPVALAHAVLLVVAAAAIRRRWAAGTGDRPLTKVPPERPRLEIRWPLWTSVVRAWRSVEREMPSSSARSRWFGMQMREAAATVR